METQLVKEFLLDFQNKLSDAILSQEIDTSYIQDEWQHASGGGGITRVLENGNVFERAGVNFSHVKGASLPSSATIARPTLSGAAFEAMGVSSVIHPVNPFVPTMHVNVRMFKATTIDGETVWWFGGGYDLTPYYPYIEDVIHWHTTAKQALDPLDTKLYPQFKKDCDDYFYLPHRDEARGVGGIFFDDLNEGGFEHCFNIAKAVAKSVIAAYMPIVKKRKETTYTEHHREFQAYRRGRYVEFNLVYDRGTLFGFKSGGRIESILVSMPPIVKWKYNFNSLKKDQEHLKNQYLKQIDWLCENKIENNAEKLLT